MKLELDAPNIGRLEKKYLNKIVDSGFVSAFGPFVTKFEKDFARSLGVRKAVSTQNGTSAIHISLYELGIEKGDEIIVSPLTFVGTTNPILYTGAKPVFVDVDKKTWNIAPSEIEKNITKKTKAIIPVHLYGNPCDMCKIMDIARRNRLYVVEDATEAFCAKLNEKHVGTFGDLGCFSFNGNKVITTGGGGMVVGNDERMLSHIKFLVNQARDESRGYYYPEMGFNYRMTNLEAALGLAQMERKEELTSKKRKFHKIYKQELKDIEYINFQEEYRNAESSWWLSCATFNKKIVIGTLQKKLLDKGVPTKRIFMPLTEFPPYKPYKKDKYKNSYDIYMSGLCLPSSTINSEEDVRYICRVLKNILKSILK